MQRQFLKLNVRIVAFGCAQGQTSQPSCEVEVSVLLCGLEGVSDGARTFLQDALLKREHSEHYSSLAALGHFKVI